MRRRVLFFRKKAPLTGRVTRQDQKPSHQDTSGVSTANINSKDTVAVRQSPGWVIVFLVRRRRSRRYLSESAYYDDCGGASNGCLPLPPLVVLFILVCAVRSKSSFVLEMSVGDKTHSSLWRSTYHHRLTR